MEFRGTDLPQLLNWCWTPTEPKLVVGAAARTPTGGFSHQQAGRSRLVNGPVA